MALRRKVQHFWTCSTPLTHRSINQMIKHVIPTQGSHVWHWVLPQQIKTHFPTYPVLITYITQNAFSLATGFGDEKVGSRQPVFFKFCLTLLPMKSITWISRAKFFYFNSLQVVMSEVGHTKHCFKPLWYSVWPHLSIIWAGLRRMGKYATPKYSAYYFQMQSLEKQPM